VRHVKRGDAARNSGLPPKSKIISPWPAGRPSLDVSFPANRLARGLCSHSPPIPRAGARAEVLCQVRALTAQQAAVTGGQV
jgi:hypothetical protein